MRSSTPSILIFGGGPLQLSIISECRRQGLFTVVIDLDPAAKGGLTADAFEVVGGDDFAGTCAVIERYGIHGIATAATDKPLLMMAKVAAKYDLQFFTERTATVSTDKYLMKQAFIECEIPCAKGSLVDQIDESLEFPCIVKPRDNSGSRGVVYCRTRDEATEAMASALACSKKATVLVEEFIEGQEYSVEALHCQGQTRVLQVTQKLVTPHPYNVELGHIQPADLSQDQRLQIDALIARVAEALNFENCASHTELKINETGIFLIETSPRLGGDFITSQLTPLSTGINMEGELIRIALGQAPRLDGGPQRASGIYYFDLFHKGRLGDNLQALDQVRQRDDVVQLSFELQPGMAIPRIRNSLDRYGYMILSAESRDSLLESANIYIAQIEDGT